MFQQTAMLWTNAVLSTSTVLSVTPEMQHGFSYKLLIPDTQIGILQLLYINVYSKICRIECTQLRIEHISNIINFMVKLGDLDISAIL